MIKIFLPIIILTTIVGCNTSNISIDYFGQSEPNTTPIIFGEDVISKKGRFEHGISFTSDTRELAFGVLDEKANSGDIYYSKKVQNKWTPPEVFKPLKKESVYLPYFSPNGEYLLYAQSIPDTNRLYITNIGRLEKTEGNWVNPKIIETPISSSSREATASMTNNETIYFSSNRNCEGKENCYTADLFKSTLAKNKYEIVEDLSVLNSSNDEESIFISPKEDYIIFCRYTDDRSFVDLYISYQDINRNWTSPKILDTSINSKYWDRRPYVSIDNKFMFFTRLTIEEYELLESDIYWVNTTKIFQPFIYNPIPNDTNQSDFDWLEFDIQNMRLSGLPTQGGEFEVVFTAVDKANNSTRDIIKLTVVK